VEQSTRQECCEEKDHGCDSSTAGYGDGENEYAQKDDQRQWNSEADGGLVSYIPIFSNMP